MPRPETLQLGALLHGSSGRIAGWRSPGANPSGELDFPFHARLAKTLEDGGFAAILIDDPAAVRGHRLDSLHRTARTGFFEPFTLLSALSSVTERIGLVATATTSCNEPYTVARKLASLDHLSGGRAGWNVATGDAHEDGAVRAAEFVDVVQGLWDSYADDAVIRDKASGIYFQRDGRQALQHVGEHFRVAGPLNIARPPQGWPVIFQADASGAGRAFAARSGEVICTAPRSIEAAVEYRTALDARIAAAGRDPGDVRVWPLLNPVVADTGSASTIADRLVAWHASGAIDGFTVSFPDLPETADRFVGEVLPLLEGRGVFRPAGHGTLREQLGLPRPVRGSAVLGRHAVRSARAAARRGGTADPGTGRGT